jgi:hypothetical protein
LYEPGKPAFSLPIRLPDQGAKYNLESEEHFEVPQLKSCPENKPSWFMFKLDVHAKNSINTSYSFEDGVYTRRFEE